MVKTSTGFADGGATIRDVELMSEYLPVKASGGVGSYEEATAMLDAGAVRIGASSGVAIVEGHPGTGTNARQATNLGRGRRRRDRLRASNRRCRRLSPRSRRSLRSPRALRPRRRQISSLSTSTSKAADTCSEPVATSPLTAATSSTPSTARWVDRAWSSAASLISWTPWFRFLDRVDDGLERATTTASSDDDASRTMPPSSIRAFVSRTVAICDSISAAAACVSSARSLDFVRDDREPLAGLAARAASMEDLRSTDRG